MVALVLLLLAGVSAQPIWQQFLKLPNNNSAHDHLQQLESRPHLAGTAGDAWTAGYVYDQFASFGLEVLNSSFDVYLPFPVKARLRGMPPFQYEADPSTSDPNVTPTFNGYSPSGVVSGEVVYVNYGTVEDFAVLASLNISAKGRIALVRYGQIYRGDKVANAADAGAVGCLIYSDPITFAPNGTSPSDVYPFTRWLPSQGVQRGSIFEGFGDPLTPGWPAPLPGDEGERISPADDNALLPRIPTQPISYGDAYPILAGLKGTLAPPAWQGGLPLQYHAGPGPFAVELTVQSDNRVATIHNVCASILGSEQPDRIVLLGNHRDAWVYGGADPNSGTATMLEIARCFGILKQGGWTPQRTIMMCSWDAEEAGTIGSTEWVERNRDLLNNRLVAYLNVDTAVSGPFFFAGAMPSFDDMIVAAAKAVPAPNNATATLYDVWVDQSGGKLPAVSRLGGCSSDYCSFVCHLGATSLDMGFSGADDSGYPMYHSVYDDLRWMELFGDPGFHFHVGMAQMWGLLALNVADSNIIPFNYTTYASETFNYIINIEALLKSVGAPSKLTTQPLHNAQARFLAAAKGVSAEMVSLAGKSGAPVRLLNDRLMLAERAMLSLGGLSGPAEVPTRSWYRHMIYAPAEHNGYASTQFPGILDSAYWAKGSAAEDPKWDEVQHQVWEAARALDRAARVLVGTFA